MVSDMLLETAAEAMRLYQRRRGAVMSKLTRAQTHELLMVT